MMYLVFNIQIAITCSRETTPEELRYSRAVTLPPGTEEIGYILTVQKLTNLPETKKYLLRDAF